jgi:hypothetical protein
VGDAAFARDGAKQQVLWADLSVAEIAARLLGKHNCASG